MKLSVIIVNYNVSYFLEQCLHSVYNSKTDFSFEVFVVDNNSVDGSCKMVREKFPQVTLIENNENVGFSRANNQAIKISKGEYILLLNPDTVIEDDTLSKVVAFMDNNEKAGGLGVRMINGEGKFLPESKRSLPTPLVAFYKIFGFSYLFPKSKTFGKYHLGYLDENQVHEVEVLAGAFMLLRKKVLDEIGLLDETFFMYGEDIDLSYRIVKAGYKNYYFPQTRIIHYKGESTKKSSINYVIVFYKAMIIFAKKHFSKQHALWLSLFINFAIYIRAGIAIIVRTLSRILFSLLDIILTYSGMYLLKNYWEMNTLYHEVVEYPKEFMTIVVPLYIFIWITSIWFVGGYDRPIKLGKVIQGIFLGTLIILVGYALLPETYRFSRALIIFGMLWFVIAATITRTILHFSGIKQFALNTKKNLRFVIVGDKEESARVSALLKQTSMQPSFIGMVSPSNQSVNNNGFIGNLSQLNEVIGIYNIDQIIFCAKDLTPQQIISKMSELQHLKVDCKIAPPESMFIIGSNSIETSAELHVININAINKPENKRHKRLFDIALSLFFMLFMPFFIIIVKKPLQFIANIFKVLSGISSWVGYYPTTVGIERLPKIKKGILTPVDAIKVENIDDETKQKLNMLYARDYLWFNDLKIVIRGYKHLGRK